jgi:hypothetical protein
LKKVDDALILAAASVEEHNSTPVWLMDPMTQMATVNAGSLDSAHTEDPMLRLVDRVETCPRNANIDFNSNNNTMLARLTFTNTELREDEGDNNNENEDEASAI